MKRINLCLLSVLCTLHNNRDPVSAMTVFDPSNYRQNVKQVTEAITQTKKQ